MVTRYFLSTSSLSSSRLFAVRNNCRHYYLTCTHKSSFPNNIPDSSGVCRSDISIAVNVGVKLWAVVTANVFPPLLSGVWNISVSPTKNIKKKQQKTYALKTKHISNQIKQVTKKPTQLTEPETDFKISQLTCEVFIHTHVLLQDRIFYHFRDLPSCLNCGGVSSTYNNCSRRLRMTCTKMTFCFSFWCLQQEKKKQQPKTLVNKDSLHLKSNEACSKLPHIYWSCLVNTYCSAYRSC